MTDLSNTMKAYGQRTENALFKYLEVGNCRQKPVIDAMRYSLSAGGKRIRPVLVLEFCRLFGGDIDKALPFAAAIEMIHTYSLIHDDLPCMDNDDMRRGKPSCHVAFGEDTALLAGDGLLTLAFSVLTSADLSPVQICDGVKTLSDAAGILGMIGGQVIDLASENKEIDLETLLELDSLKTGALLRAAAKLGCIAAGANQEQTDIADQYAAAIGLAFQIVDDILDVTGNMQSLGKPIGSDMENKKSTFVSIYGLEGAKAKALEQTETAKSLLSSLHLDTAFLYDLADYLIQRKN